MNRDFLRQAQQMQARIAKIQEELGNEVVETTAGGGAVTVTITGHLKIQSVKISPDVVDPQDVEMLEDLVTAAMNDAVEKAQSLASSRLGAVTGGLKLPGM